MVAAVDQLSREGLRVGSSQRLCSQRTQLLPVVKPQPRGRHHAWAEQAGSQFSVLAAAPLALGPKASLRCHLCPQVGVAGSGEAPHFQVLDAELLPGREGLVVEGLAGVAAPVVQVPVQPQPISTTGKVPMAQSAEGPLSCPLCAWRPPQPPPRGPATSLCLVPSC